MDKLLKNIHGTDAALLAVCYCIWQLAGAKNTNPELVHYGIQCMMFLGMVIMAGRVALSIIALFREKNIKKEIKKPKTVR